MQALGPWRCLAGLLLWSLLCAPRAQGQQTTPPTPGDKKPATINPLDLLKLPSGAIVVLCEQARDGGLPVPRSVLVPLEEYQKLLDQLEQARKPGKPDKFDTPTRCHLSGRVDSDVVHLRVRFGFRTYKPRAIMHLGCLKAWLKDAKLDGELPILQIQDDGLQVQVEQPGEHQVELDLVLPHQLRRGGKGRERVLELDLPRTAITMIDSLELPAQAAEVRLAGRSVPLKKSASGNQCVERVACNYADLMDLSWRFPEAKATPAAPLLASTGKFVARVAEGGIAFEGELILRVLQGETALWQLALPAAFAASAEVNVSAADQPRVLALERPADGQEPVWTIRLREPSAEPLHLKVQARQAWQKGPVDLGPVRVLHSLSQKGEIELKAPIQLRLRPELKGEISQKELPEEASRDNIVAAYSYWSSPDRANAAETVPGYLRLHVEPVTGSLAAKMGYTFRYLEGMGDEGPSWKVTVKVEVIPGQTSVETVELRVPEDTTWEPAAGPGGGELIEQIIPGPDKKTLQVVLAQKQMKPFVFQLVETYRLPKEARTLERDLPRCLTWSSERNGRSSDAPQPTPPVQDLGAVLQVQMPEKWELLTGSWSEFWKVLPIARPQPGLRDYAWQIDATPKAVHFSWRPFTPVLTAESVLDVELLPTQGRVQQLLRFTRPAGATYPIFLRVPTTVLDAVEIKEGGRRATDLETSPGVLAILLDPRTEGHDSILRLEYRLPLPAGWPERGGDLPAQPEDAEPVKLAFVVPEQASRHQIRLRLWTEADVQPELADKLWEPLPAELVAGRRGLPALVARAQRAEQIAFTVHKRPLEALAAAFIDRVLVRATLATDGTQTMTVAYALSHLQQKQLDLELPSSLGASALAVSIDGQSVPVESILEPRREGSGLRIVRVPVEAFWQRPSVILQVTYQITGGYAAEDSPMLTSLFDTPRLRGALQVGKTRWSITLPDNHVALWTNGLGEPRQRWGLWGFLLAPRPAWSDGQLEQWLGLNETSVPADADVALVVGQDTLSPVEVVHMPDRLWLVLGSFVFLCISLLAYLAPKRRLFTALLLGLTIPLAVWLLVQHIAFLRMLLFAFEPGFLVLVIVGCLEWLLRRRSHRKLLFLPSYQRVKSGSSLVREGVGVAGKGPSTVDDPGRRGSSLNGPTSGEGAS